MERLPKSVDYSTPLSTMPDSTVSYIVSNTPTNGSSFTPGTTIIVDLNNVQGFLDPASLSIRYKYTATAASKSSLTVGQNCGIVGCPAYPFIRLDVLANSSVIESINNYNSLATMLTNTTYDVAQKLGMQPSMGWAGIDGDATMSNQNNTDGIILTTALASSTLAVTDESNFISAPLLGCSLSNCEKLVPLNACSWRLQFTLDALSNIGSNLAVDAPLSAYTITNFEVVYNQIQFPSNVHQQIMSLPKIRIKTKSYGTGTQAITATATGTVNLYYNLRYASVRALFLTCGGSSTTLSANKLMDAVDPTGTAGGTIQFSVGGLVIPQNPFNTTTNRSGIITELRRAALGNIYDRGNSLSIGASEFNITSAGTTSITIPGKFIVGVNTQKLSDSVDYMFTGISSANSQINVIINIGTAPTGNALTAILYASYDAIYEIDPLNKQLNYIQ
jgi:hypothetical protein